MSGDTPLPILQIVSKSKEFGESWRRLVESFFSPLFVHFLLGLRSHNWGGWGVGAKEKHRSIMQTKLLCRSLSSSTTPERVLPSIISVVSPRSSKHGSCPECTKFGGRSCRRNRRESRDFGTCSQPPIWWKSQNYGLLLCAILPYRNFFRVTRAPIATTGHTLQKEIQTKRGKRPQRLRKNPSTCNLNHKWRNPVAEPPDPCSGVASLYPDEDQARIPKHSLQSWTRTFFNNTGLFRFIEKLYMHKHIYTYWQHDTGPNFAN